jgi:uncharacterized protein YecE (DUF72 family)
MSHIYIGITGYNYPGWRGSFYPRDLAVRRWLKYASRLFNSIELNGTFYSLKSPAVFCRWAAETPDSFTFAIKGSRFITHNLKFARATTALGNFYASGVLALGNKTGPFLWQLPPTWRFHRERIEAFLQQLPRDTDNAARVARRHDARLKARALLKSTATVAYRHAFEVRHPSFFTQEFYDLLRAYDAALVIADTAGKYPMAEESTADFVYVRLHGSTACMPATTPMQSWTPGRIASRVGGTRGGMSTFTSTTTRWPTPHITPLPWLADSRKRYEFDYHPPQCDGRVPVLWHHEPRGHGAGCRPPQVRKLRPAAVVGSSRRGVGREFRQGHH